MIETRHKPIYRILESGQTGPHYRGLGDICTSPMCSAGAASVQEMDSVYQSLDASIQGQFSSAHDSIMAAFNSNYSWYSGYIPFNPNCCTIQSIGSQADQLTSEMQQAAGQVPNAAGPGTQSPPASPFSLGLGSGLGLAAVVVVGLWLWKK